jgi:hypothetical protein
MQKSSFDCMQEPGLDLRGITVLACELIAEFDASAHPSVTR